jgi:hypothetical protein
VIRHSVDLEFYIEVPVSSTDFMSLRIQAQPPVPISENLLATIPAMIGAPSSSWTTVSLEKPAATFRSACGAEVRSGSAPPKPFEPQHERHRAPDSQDHQIEALRSNRRALQERRSKSFDERRQRQRLDDRLNHLREAIG